jgi:hypothetical protein
MGSVRQCYFLCVFRASGKGSDGSVTMLWEFKRVLHRHEEIAQANNSAILVITSKVEELEQSCISHNANFSILLLSQKCRIDLLEAECSRL